MMMKIIITVRTKIFSKIMMTTLLIRRLCCNLCPGDKLDSIHPSPVRHHLPTSSSECPLNIFIIFILILREPSQHPHHHWLAELFFVVAQCTVQQRRQFKQNLSWPNMEIFAKAEKAANMQINVCSRKGSKGSRRSIFSQKNLYLPTLYWAVGQPLWQPLLQFENKCHSRKPALTLES